MASDALSERLRWTLEWQTRKLIPQLHGAHAEERLRGFWQDTRYMAEVVAQAQLSERSVSIDVGGGLTTPLRWLPGQRVCVDPLSARYQERLPLPHGQVSYLVGQGESLPLRSGVADLAIYTNCVDHTDDPWQVMREISRVLRPGGWLWLSCELNPPDQERNPGHPHAIDREALSALIAGFDVIRSWETPWRGVYRYLTGRPPFPAIEMVFLLRKGERHDA